MLYPKPGAMRLAFDESYVMASLGVLAKTNPAGGKAAFEIDTAICVNDRSEVISMGDLPAHYGGPKQNQTQHRYALRAVRGERRFHRGGDKGRLRG